MDGVFVGEETGVRRGELRVGLGALLAQLEEIFLDGFWGAFMALALEVGGDCGVVCFEAGRGDEVEEEGGFGFVGPLHCWR